MCKECPFCIQDPEVSVSEKLCQFAQSPTIHVTHSCHVDRPLCMVCQQVKYPELYPRHLNFLRHFAWQGGTRAPGVQPANQLTLIFIVLVHQCLRVCFRKSRIATAFRLSTFCDSQEKPRSSQFGPGYSWKRSMKWVFRLFILHKTPTNTTISFFKRSNLVQ